MRPTRLSEFVHLKTTKQWKKKPQKTENKTNKKQTIESRCVLRNWHAEVFELTDRRRHHFFFDMKQLGMRAVDVDGMELDLTVSCSYQKSIRDGATMILTAYVECWWRKNFFCFCFFKNSSVPAQFILYWQATCHLSICHLKSKTFRHTKLKWSE